MPLLHKFYEILPFTKNMAQAFKIKNQDVLCGRTKHCKVHKVEQGTPAR